MENKKILKFTNTELELFLMLNENLIKNRFNRTIINYRKNQFIIRTFKDIKENQLINEKIFYIDKNTLKLLENILNDPFIFDFLDYDFNILRSVYFELKK